MVARAHRLWVLIFAALAFAACTPSTPAPRDGLAAELLKESATPRWEGEGKLHVPGKNASTEELLAFWTSDLAVSGGMFEAGGLQVPAGGVALTPQVREQLLTAALAEPRYLPQVLRRLPDTPAAREAVHAMYLRMKDAPGSNLPEDWTPDIHDWLMHHGYFRADLLAAAKAVKFEAGDLSHESELQALMDLDWPAARAVLQDLARDKDVHVASAACALLYTHTPRAPTDDPAPWRTRLQAVAADQAAPAWARDRAFDALLSDDWPGKDAWFLSLFRDPGLEHLEEGIYGFQFPLSRWATKPPRPPLDHLVPLLTSADTTTRCNAALVLLYTDDPAAIPILLSHRAAWPANFESKLVRELGRVKAPGAVTFLMEAHARGSEYDKWEATLALARQNAPEARALLRAYLSDPQAIRDGEDLANALVQTETLTEDELEGLLTGDLWPDLSETSRFDLWKFPDFDTQDELAERLVGHLHRETRPQEAMELWSHLSRWPVSAIDAEIAQRLTSNQLDKDLIILALHRPDLAKLHAVQLRKMAEGPGLRAGLAAAILDDTAVSRRILQSGDGPAAQMLLACARLKPAKLPLDAVGRLLSSADPALSQAAEAFLLLDDSPDAQRLVRAHHPGTLLVLGNGRSFPDPESTSIFPEERLRREMLQPQPPTEIIALFSAGGFGNDGQRVIRIQAGRATLAMGVGHGKQLIRELTAQEIRDLQKFIAQEHVDDMPPLANDGVLDGVWYTYLHVTPQGGRTMDMNNPGVHGTRGTVYDRLTRRFRALTGTGNVITRYDLETAIPGTRVLFYGDKTTIHRVAMREGTILVDTGNGGDPGAWHAFRHGQPAEAVPPPDPGSALSLASAFSGSIKTPDGKWSIAEERFGEQKPSRLARVNEVRGGKDYFDLPADHNLAPVAYLPLLKKILVSGTLPDHWGEPDLYWLADPETLACTPIHGDFRAVIEWRDTRAPSAGPNQVWLTWVDRDHDETLVESWNTETLEMQIIAHLPEVQANSASGAVWVDALAHKLYLVLNGDLLEVPLH